MDTYESFRELTTEETTGIDGGAVFAPPPINMNPAVVQLAASQGKLPAAPNGL